MAAGFFLEASGVGDGSSSISPSSRWSSAGEGLFHQDGKSFATVDGGVRLAAGFFLEASGVCDGTFGVGKTFSAVAGKESFE